MRVKVAVTGSSGFIGKHLVRRLRQDDRVSEVVCVTADVWERLPELLYDVDVVFHLAGVNRAVDTVSYTANSLLTNDVCQALLNGNPDRLFTPLMVFTSSIKVHENSPYGYSKLSAEETMRHLSWGRFMGAYVRLPNVFGPGCRPNYNNVVATFCDAVLRRAPLPIDNADKRVPLVYIDDAVELLWSKLDWYIETAEAHQPLLTTCDEIPVPPDIVHTITVGDLALTINSFNAIIHRATMPDLSDPFVRRLLTTFFSYIAKDERYIPFDALHDQRGYLFEVVKSAYAGQVSVSVTRSGETRGGHYHKHKVELFMVVSGKASVTFCDAEADDGYYTTYSCGAASTMCIPAGYAHWVTNPGKEDLVMLFWSSEPYDCNAPDTYKYQEGGHANQLCEEG